MAPKRLHATLGIRTPPPLVVENVRLVSNRGVDSVIRLAKPSIVNSTQTFGPTVCTRGPPSCPIPAPAVQPSSVTVAVGVDCTSLRTRRTCMVRPRCHCQARSRLSRVPQGLRCEVVWRQRTAKTEPMKFAQKRRLSRFVKVSNAARNRQKAWGYGRFKASLPDILARIFTLLRYIRIAKKMALITRQ